MNSYHRNHHFVFIDEIGFNNSLSINYGYSKKGKKAVNFTFPKSPNLTVMAAMDTEQILGIQILKGGAKA